MSVPMADDEPWEEDDTPDKDSGLESLNGSSEEEDELTQRIVAQVEFYFSDENILRDSFLLKHVRRNREGYVSLKLMASFRKVKSLTKNWELVREALRASSTRLEVNAEGTKVRRREPLPDHDETAPSRTVVAYPLPERASVEAIAEMFSRCGPISLLRLLRPGGTVPPCAKRFLQRHPDATGCPAAVVEFERHDGASQALRQGSQFLRVLPLATGQPGVTSGGFAAALEDSRKRRPVTASLLQGTISSSSLGPRHKSHSQGDVSAGLWVKKRAEGSSPVLRQPRGPDGTRGFHQDALRTTPCLLAPS
ncbi:la-related protein 6 [Ixodes scapularis]|uniref:la-related protein 6 n=1 Tax=Ixodes scapularis TaxID=6945 RepID=UPI0011618A35|nr:la-related protein 6 [Ixodes scapularis]